jgi:hypothetical protein
MRDIETQVWLEQDDPAYGRGIYARLASEPFLCGLHEGDPEILREPPDVEVDAIMCQARLNGRDAWLATLTSAYRDLAPTQ